MPIEQRDELLSVLGESLTDRLEPFSGVPKPKGLDGLVGPPAAHAHNHSAIHDGVGQITDARQSDRAYASNWVERILVPSPTHRRTVAPLRCPALTRPRSSSFGGAVGPKIVSTSSSRIVGASPVSSRTAATCRNIAAIDAFAAWTGDQASSASSSNVRVLPDRLHDLRHTHATLLLQSGEPVRTVSQRLGHASAVVTMTIYSHVLPGDDRQAADHFDRLVPRTGTTP